MTFFLFKNLGHIGDIESLSCIANVILSKAFRWFRVSTEHISSSVLIINLNYYHCNGTFHNVHCCVMQQDFTYDNVLWPGLTSFTATIISAVFTERLNFSRHDRSSFRIFSKNRRDINYHIFHSTLQSFQMCKQIQKVQSKCSLRRRRYLPKYKCSFLRYQMKYP